MNLFDELNKVINDLPFHKHQKKQADIACFCEHDGICIKFTRAGFSQAANTWHALAPCALKPWWLFLNPLRKNQPANKNIKIKTNAAKAETIEVTENA